VLFRSLLLTLFFTLTLSETTDPPSKTLEEPEYKIPFLKMSFFMKHFKMAWDDGSQAPNPNSRAVRGVLGALRMT